MSLYVYYLCINKDILLCVYVIRKLCSYSFGHREHKIQWDTRYKGQSCLRIQIVLASHIHDLHIGTHISYESKMNDHDFMASFHQNVKYIYLLMNIPKYTVHQLK